MSGQIPVGRQRILAAIEGEHGNVERFAVDLGVASKTVYRWLKGSHAPRASHRLLLATRLGGAPDDYRLDVLEPAA